MLENLTAMELVDSMTTHQAKELFADSFKYENVFTMSAASKVLAKRGCYEDITKIVLAYFESGQTLKLGSSFAISLGQSLYDLRKSSASLGRIGLMINKRSTKSEGKGVYDFKTLEEDLAELNDGKPVASMPKMHFLDLATLEEREVTETSIIEHLKSLSTDEIVKMDYDDFNAIVHSLVNLYMHKFYQAEGGERVTATEEALKTIRDALEPHICEIIKNHRLYEKMNRWVYHELVQPLVSKQ